MSRRGAVPARIVTSLALSSLAIAAPSPAARAAEPVLRDVTSASGITYRNVCGAPIEGKGWLTELMGAGAAWLDYDGDGHLDLYIVNGSAHDRPRGRGEPNLLLRGDGKGRFHDVTTAAGVGDRGWGYGVAVGDIDNDGDPDIYVTNLGPNVLYLNNGNGTFTDATARAGVGDDSWGTSAAFTDIDGDGWLDLYVANYVDFDTNRVPRRGAPEVRSNPACTISGIPVACGPRGLPPAQDVLYRNRGDGRFENVTRSSGVALAAPRYALGVVTGDLDGDGDQEIYVANDSMQNSLWSNDGRGRFTDRGVATLSALSLSGGAQAGMGTDLGDPDGDGWLDIVVTNFSQDLNTLYRNVAGRYFTDVSFETGLGSTFMALSWGVGFHDLDNDTDEDLFIANGHIYPEVDGYDIGTRFRQKNHLFVNEGPKFRLAAATGGLAVERSFRGAAFADYDDDGDVDIFLTALGEPGLLLRNDTPGAGHYLEIRLIGAARPGSHPAAGESGPGIAAGSPDREITAGPADGTPRKPEGRETADLEAGTPMMQTLLPRSNRDAVGARVTVLAGGRRMIRERKGGGSYLSASETRLHFGLGGTDRAEMVEVRWPSGRVRTLRDVPADRVITIEETDAAGP